MPGFLPGGSGGTEVQEGNAALDKNLSRYGFTPSVVVPLETLISYTSSSNSRNERISVLSLQMLSLLEPLRGSTETGFELTLKLRKV